MQEREGIRTPIIGISEQQIKSLQRAPPSQKKLHSRQDWVIFTARMPVRAGAGLQYLEGKHTH